jgi:hypothetical protein
VVDFDPDSETVSSPHESQDKTGERLIARLRPPRRSVRSRRLGPEGRSALGGLLRSPWRSGVRRLHRMLLGLVIGDGEKREIGFKRSGTDANRV